MSTPLSPAEIRANRRERMLRLHQMKADLEIKIGKIVDGNLKMPNVKRVFEIELRAVIRELDRHKQLWDRGQ